MYKIKKQSKSKSAIVTILSLIVLGALGYLATVRIAALNPDAAFDFGRVNSTFQLTLTTTVTKKSNLLCSSEVDSYKITVDTYHRASMGKRATAIITVPVGTTTTTSTITAKNPDGVIARQLQPGYYQYFYTVSALDKAGMTLATKPGTWGAKSGSTGPTIKTIDSLTFDCNLDTLTPPVANEYQVKTTYTVNQSSCSRIGIAYYVVSVVPYQQASNTHFPALAQTFTIAPSSTSGVTQVSFPELQTTNPLYKQVSGKNFSYLNSFFVYTVKGVDKAGKTLISYQSTRTRTATYTKPLYKFVTSPYIAEGKLTFDCNLKSVY